MVVGEHDNRAARVTRGHHNVLQGITRVTFGVHNDQVGLQLGNAFS
jgi:hypothetical protein